MIIQINTDNNVHGHENFQAEITARIEGELNRYNEVITRLEVHLSDENGNKSGQDDKRCLIEARLEGKKPIAVTAQSNSHERATSDALSKLKASLETVLGKSRNF